MPMIQPKINPSQIAINQLTAANPQLNGYLTPDALMAYCSTRLRGLDDQMKEAFTKQQSANHDSSILSKLASSLGAPTTDLGVGGENDARNWFKTSAQAMLDAAKDVSDPSVKAALIAKANLLYPTKDDGNGNFTLVENGTVGDGKGAYISSGTVSIATFKAMTGEAVAGIQKDLNSNTELSMINLQSLMSQRQSSVQLITNMVQSLGDQLNKIASNIGH